MNSPHAADRLVERYLSARRKAAAARMPRLHVSRRVISDLHNIASGVFTPLEGFMDHKAMESVLNKCRLPSGAVWTIPIVLDASERALQGLRPGKETTLADEQGEIHGVMEISGIFAHDKHAHARRLYATVELEHPGVRSVFAMGDMLVAGRVRAFPGRKANPRYLDPRQTRRIFAERGYASVAGFQTRNIPHRAHEYLQRCALEIVDGLFIQPIVGWVKSGDYLARTITRIYPEFMRDFYPKRSVLFGVLDTAMRYAGPKEAAFHAVIRKNFGCTHFIVGRDHAGVGGYYGHYEAHDFLSKLGDFGIKILMFKEPRYCSRCRLIVTEKTCGHVSKHHHAISGTLIRSYLRDHKRPPDYIFRPEVYESLQKLYDKGEIFHR